MNQIFTLPGSYYNDEVIFKKELKYLFSRTWQYVCREDELRERGSYLTVTLGREPILLMRGQDNKLRAYHNICPHRGARLLQGKGKCQGIICPYHAWRFHDDGRLHHIPRKKWFSDLNIDNLSLRPASVDSWRGFVFVNPVQNCTPLKTWLANYDSYLNQYEFRYEDMIEIDRFVFDEAVNWKILVENYVEDYHFAYVHPQTLGAFDFNSVQTLRCGAHIQIPMPYKNTPPRGHSKYQWAANGVSRQGFIFPLLTVQPAINHLSLFIIKPVSAERTIIEIPVYQTAAQRQSHPLDLDELKHDIFNDMEEDFVICRSLQINTHSSRFSINALADKHEHGVKIFQDTWRRFMNAHIN
ncbi:aromatic ring-hydroxylating oxygenase subunit alpha [Pseudomonas putida]